MQVYFICSFTIGIFEFIFIVDDPAKKHTMAGPGSRVRKITN